MSWCLFMSVFAYFLAGQHLVRALGHVLEPLHVAGRAGAIVADNEHGIAVVHLVVHGEKAHRVPALDALYLDAAVRVDICGRRCVYVFTCASRSPVLGRGLIAPVPELDIALGLGLGLYILYRPCAARNLNSPGHAELATAALKNCVMKDCA